MVQEMFELMYEHQGVGLAANQVDLPYRLFVTNIEANAHVKEAEKVFINPVLNHTGRTAEAEEGCLSIPEVFGQVKRAEKVKITAFTLTGEEITQELAGLAARVVQHEVDHLDGTLFVDRLGPTSDMVVREALHEMELEFQSRRDLGQIPDDQHIFARLQELETLRT